MNKEIITALVDGEIMEASVRSEVELAIITDKSLAVDYKIQLLMKNIVGEKVKFQKTPELIRNRILNSLHLKERTDRFSFLTNLFTKTAFTFATSIVVILAVILILFNRPDPVEIKDFAIEQKGSSNMFVQAKNNFQSIVDGKLAPQFISSNPDAIRDYFETNGVKYSTIVPSFSDWNLVGSFISEDNGVKFTHLIYADKNNHLIYLFQVAESYLYSHKRISLSNNLIKYLDEGNCYTTSYNGKAILLTKCNNNIFDVVSNADVSEIENNFRNLH